MKTETYKVGVNGYVDYDVVFDTYNKAILHALSVWDKAADGDNVSVYGECTYSEDDMTPLCARTYFWRHCYISKFGKIAY